MGPMNPMGPLMDPFKPMCHLKDHGPLKSMGYGVNVPLLPPLSEALIAISEVDHFL